MKTYTRIVLPKQAKPPPRDAMARTIMTMPDLGQYVNTLRTALSIRQAELAARAGVSRQWIVALEQGKPSLEAGKVLRTLEALGFEIVLTPYLPVPPWMLRAVRAAHEKSAATKDGRRVRRNGRRAKARDDRLADNTLAGMGVVDVE